MKVHLRRVVACTVLALALGSPDSGHADAAARLSCKLDPVLLERVWLPGRSQVIVRGAGPGVGLGGGLGVGLGLGASASASATASAGMAGGLLSSLPYLGARLVRQLPIVDGVVLDLPNAAVAMLAASPRVSGISIDRAVTSANERTGATIGATAVREALGYDGTGVGVAIIDSGIAPFHDDLTDPSGAGQRIDKFVNFVSGNRDVEDDYGHGTHVAGIIAGNGHDSDGARTGVAPGAHLIVLKVLDGSGEGRVSDVIAALGYAVRHKAEFNIRIINLSVATGVFESYNTDPLALAARQAVSAGIVVVAAAGNNGRGPLGRTRYGGVTAPGNAPWVLTVGASSHMGTADRADDTMAPFSSRGPGAIDFGAKPDLVAPGVGIESLSDPESRLYRTASPYLLSGTVPTSYLPYLSQSGTSMSAPVVAGTVALMLQANPALTPNLVKAILQYTAQRYDGYDRLTQGAGFLNARGAVELAAYLAAPDTVPYPSAADWGGRLIWGNYMAQGGRLAADANAWDLDRTWGDTSTDAGDPVRWGTIGDAPWQIDATLALPNVVWGTLCGGANCDGAWDVQNVFGATDLEGDTVVWGTSDAEADTVVWGTSAVEGETVVWGTSCTDPSCVPAIWPRP